MRRAPTQEEYLDHLASGRAYVGPLPQERRPLSATERRTLFAGRPVRAWDFTYWEMWWLLTARAIGLDQWLLRRWLRRAARNYAEQGHSDSLLPLAEMLGLSEGEALGVARRFKLRQAQRAAARRRINV